MPSLAGFICCIDPLARDTGTISRFRLLNTPVRMQRRLWAKASAESAKQAVHRLARTDQQSGVSQHPAEQVSAAVG